ncbi:unnamed protein product [Durusdinium trenchii]|uniref:Poly [ADP-ribose] polymerase n=1 Tax=Durusdinium trenchii TaxID=1381693 RepID=A0ABP0PFI8_9DINO
MACEPKRQSSSSSRCDLPTPQRKRRRTQGEVSDDEGDVVILDTATVPCEVCGANVAFEHFMTHLATHEAAKMPDTDDLEEIECEVCGKWVLFRHFMEHSQLHSASSSSSKVCGVLFAASDLADHKAAHQMHEKMLDEDLKSSTSEVDITAQIVEMARSGGSGLPGNRSVMGEGDPVLVRWSDGHWYPARVTSIHSQQYQVSWDPPYQCWAPEKVAEASVIPRMNQPREVCNFDVALEFVKRLRSLKHRSSQSTRLEVVYHWTREENVNKIIENNLKPPGATNADGTQIHVLNGEAFGRGIYASTDVNYGRAYGAGLSCGFLCLAFPGHMGRTPHGKGIPKRLCKKDDCYQQGSLRVYRSSEQVLPLFFTDLPTAPRLSEVAQTIARVLRERVLEQSVTELEFKKGEKVEVLWHGSYWQAEVAQVRADGLLDVKWLFPFQTWPAECGVSTARLRRPEGH